MGGDDEIFFVTSPTANSHNGSMRLGASRGSIRGIGGGEKSVGFLGNAIFLLLSETQHQASTVSYAMSPPRWVRPENSSLPLSQSGDAAEAESRSSQEAREVDDSDGQCAMSSQLTFTVV